MRYLLALHPPCFPHGPLTRGKNCGRRDSNPRPEPFEGSVLSGLNYSRCFSPEPNTRGFFISKNQKKDRGGSERTDRFPRASPSTLPSPVYFHRTPGNDPVSSDRLTTPRGAFSCALFKDQKKEAIKPIWRSRPRWTRDLLHTQRRDDLRYLYATGPNDSCQVTGCSLIF